MPKEKLYQKPQTPTGTQPVVKIYNIEVSIKPIYFTVGEACKTRREAERFAEYAASHPFEFVSAKRYASWRIEGLGSYPRRRKAEKP